MFYLFRAIRKCDWDESGYFRCKNPAVSTTATYYVAIYEGLPLHLACTTTADLKWRYGRNKMKKGIIFYLVVCMPTAPTYLDVTYS